MVNLYSKFISCSREANISRVAGEASWVCFPLQSLYFMSISWLLVPAGFFADHFDHIKKVIGAESIGIGGDFEGAEM